jgi:hypothetical protein
VKCKWHTALCHSHHLMPPQDVGRSIPEDVAPRRVLKVAWSAKVGALGVRSVSFAARPRMMGLDARGTGAEPFVGGGGGTPASVAVGWALIS